MEQAATVGEPAVSHYAIYGFYFDDWELNLLLKVDRDLIYFVVG